MYSVYATMTIPEHNTLLGMEKSRTYRHVWLLTATYEECAGYVEKILQKDARYSEIAIERE